MKKLLTILGSIGLIATTSAAVIACGDKTPQKISTENKDKNTTEESKDNKPTEESIKEDKEKTEQPKKEEKQKYVLQRSRENNFSLTKDYGLKHTDFTWNNQDKWSKWKSDSKNSSLASLIGQVTTFYSKISKYASVVELEKEFENKLNQNRNYKSFEEFIEKMDMTITKYLEQKDSIWNALNTL
ncbi:lipoprotein [Mycoplasma mycoides subsp. capri]|uniref:lipoprotein n=1 Tax=Mycoplasma mycoides TaxID=2102 RepID=UPI00223FC929|nr:lipoprotein [Mycoplasma mycoides]QVK02230.1 lipoprotein [Mycoplasma mycoides subsp. capri]